jgi:hypothetical protein
MPVSEKVLEELRKEPDVQLDLSWLNPPTEQGMSARPGRRGLTLEDVEQGSYGQVRAAPERAPHRRALE